jgi:acyl-CoA synthetase (AMP-forming)/AMP-acid ligase II/aryl carrier-like protein
MTGGKAILVDSMMALEEAVQAGSVHLLNTVPSIMAELVRSGKLPAGIRVVNLAGERLSLDLVDEIYASGKVGRVVDLYGPTETTTYSSYGPRAAGENAASIGRAISNVQLYVLNEELQPVPPTAVGEIWIGGGGVTRGYLGQAGLTAEKFRPDPYAGEAGARMYGTGDRGRYRTDGRLEYLGRQDRQVKLRGYRVELDEIEVVLKRATGVRDCAVAVLPEAAGGVLAAWVVGEGEIEQWRCWVEQHLPGYMVPAHWMSLPALPRHPNGKLDYAALPEPELRDGRAAVPPRTERERMIASVWSELLRLRHEHPSVDDNFFRAGGHSLLAMRLLSRLEHQTGLALDLAQFFERPTIAALAKQLETATPCLIPPDVSSYRESEVLRRLDELTESEIDQILATIEADNDRTQ